MYKVLHPVTAIKISINLDGVEKANTHQVIALIKEKNQVLRDKFIVLINYLTLGLIIYLNILLKIFSIIYKRSILTLIKI